MSALIKHEDSSRLDVKPVAHQLAEAYWNALEAEGVDRAAGGHHALRDKQQLIEASPKNLEWCDLSYAEELEPGAAFEVYDHLMQAARDELESGERAAGVVANGMWRPWVKARYLALRGPSSLTGGRPAA